GRTVASSYQRTWVSGRVRKSTKAHAASLLSQSVYTTRLAPPTNDVAESLAGIVETPHLPSMSAPPASVMRPMCHGPENIIGVVPLTKVCVGSVPSGT